MLSGLYSQVLEGCDQLTLQLYCLTEMKNQNIHKIYVKGYSLLSCLY